jgi:hypothetical protein
MSFPRCCHPLLRPATVTNPSTETEHSEHFSQMTEIKRERFPRMRAPRPDNSDPRAELIATGGKNVAAPFKAGMKASALLCV